MSDSLLKRYSFKLIASILSGIVNAIIVALVPSAMGPTAYGQFTYLQHFFNQVIAFLDAGTSTAFFTKLSAENDRLSLVVFYFYFSIGVFLALLFFLGFVSIFGILGVLAEGIDFYSFFLGMVLGYIVWLYQISVRISDAFALTVPVEVFKIVHKLALLASLVFVISFFQLSLDIYLVFLSFATMLFVLILVVFFFKKQVFLSSELKKSFPIKKMINEFWEYVLPLFSFNVLSVLVAFFDLWLLQYISGTDSVGFYGLAYSIAAMCFVFTSAMTPVITREYSKLYAEGDLETIKELYEKYLPILYLLAAYFGVFIAFNSEFVLYVFADERYNAAIVTLSLMALYPLHQTFGQITSSLFFASGETVRYRNIGVVTSLIGVFLTLFFVVFLELADQGFALKMLIAQLIGVNVQLFYNSKMLSFDFYKYLLLQIRSVCVLILIAYGVGFVVPDFSSSAAEFFCLGLLYSVVVLMILLTAPVLFGVSKDRLYKQIGLIVSWVNKKVG